ncbi:MAG: hypothetical protein ACSHXK_03965 [Oceanococcus sp.]
MLFSNPRVLPALLLCIGLTIFLMRGQELKNMEAWNPSDIETAVELNYALDLVRRGEAPAPSELEKQTRQAEIRSEIVETFIAPQEKTKREHEQAKWMAIAGAILMVLVLLLQQRGILKK